MSTISPLFYKINNSLSIDKIAKDINKLFSQIPQEELKDCLLKITVQKISSYAGDSPLSKIEYKPEDSPT